MVAQGQGRGPGAEPAGHVDMPGKAEVDQFSTPDLGQMAALTKGHPRVVAAGHHRCGHAEGAVRLRRATARPRLRLFSLRAQGRSGGKISPLAGLSGGDILPIRSGCSRDSSDPKRSFAAADTVGRDASFGAPHVSRAPSICGKGKLTTQRPAASRERISSAKADMDEFVAPRNEAQSFGTGDPNNPSSPKERTFFCSLKRRPGAATTPRSHAR